MLVVENEKQLNDDDSGGDGDGGDVNVNESVSDVKEVVEVEVEVEEVVPLCLVHHISVCQNHLHRIQEFCLLLHRVVLVVGYLEGLVL